MSKESATRFLQAISADENLREKFESVQDSEEFIRIAEQLGYSFTTQELMTLAKEQSQGIAVRRHTGVWRWLRGVNWV